MIRKVCKMKLYKNCYDEYKKRHDEIWLEMKEELKKHGYDNYSIFLDEETGYLFSYVEARDEKSYNEMANTEICQKWWKYMKDIMETNEDNSPKSVDLKKIFYLP
ncbi:MULTISPECIES: L-rhamnose mutarotase [Clostridium]|uniref:L-rhamnose mutarotase n=3 Tax=Clostridium TaxID=1485 RepID=D8GJV7_CLOLD|nr:MULTISPECIES: L-rhamnose mutarotase [Clostridium]ADK17259.1 putative L-rhamnose mutarotase [Clostridium ljungdahlii DSM 13528]AGY76302.1 L-rhamnose mutarotase [Clostridium autoethanogenum DSM 10061]ALU36461.1 L-rhamnose mutarotase [Clostridium autoethanogenum DSM 10061]OAA84127.1 L-rhamnose mutarotase [Clostridium ljungdahlii DSM 13528]OVY48967.1 L-rhamnose mutarotase [Clostridium autoethanogenum]